MHEGITTVSYNWNHKLKRETMNEYLLIILFVVLIIVPRFFVSKFTQRTQSIIKAVSGAILLALVWNFGLKGGINIYLLIGITLIFIFSLGREILKNSKPKEVKSHSKWTHEE